MCQAGLTQAGVVLLDLADYGQGSAGVTGSLSHTGALDVALAVSNHSHEGANTKEGAERVAGHVLEHVLKNVHPCLFSFQGL